MTEADGRGRSADQVDPASHEDFLRPPLRLAQLVEDQIDPPGTASPAVGVAGGPQRTGRGSRGVLVEFVRLIMVALFAVAGWEVASHIGPEQSERMLSGTLL